MGVRSFLAPGVGAQESADGSLTPGICPIDPERRGPYLRIRERKVSGMTVLMTTRWAQAQTDPGGRVDAAILGAE
jgi:hypothetical protein